MALAAATVWEVRTAGADANGGGFVAGASGTDRSQQDAAQIAYTDLVLATTTTLTSALNPFSAAEVGNILNITGGAGFTPGWYQIVSVSVVTATIDRVGGTLGSTGGTGNLGGALATPAQALTNHVGSNTVWVKTGTYLQTAILPSLAAGVAGALTRLSGYNATRGDLDTVTDFSNFPTLQNDNVVAHILDMSNTLCLLENLIFHAGTAASRSSRCVQDNGGGNTVVNCKFLNFTDIGFYDAGSGDTLVRCWATAGASGIEGAFTGSSTLWIGCVASANGGPGWWALNQGASLINCLSLNNTSAAGHGFYFTAGLSRLVSCIARGNAGDGIRYDGALIAKGVAVYNSIFSENTGYGINSLTTAWTRMQLDYNAFWSNTAGARNQVPAGAHDVTLTADPFTNAAANDFTLNNVAGGGAACRAAGFPGVLSGL